MSGHAKLERPGVAVKILDEIHSDGRETYARAVVTTDERGGYVATTTGAQGSHVMTSLVKANALVIVPEGVTFVPSGGTLRALMIDWPPEVF
jgi:molybdopterin molybdotransferase